MKSVVAKLNPYSSDIEEGQLPSCALQQPINATFAPHDQPRKHYQTEQRPHNRTAETVLDLHPFTQPKPPTHDFKSRQIEYEILQPKTHPKDSYSPDRKKKSHKSEHRSRHHHHTHTPDKQRQKQFKRFARKEKQFESNHQQQRRTHHPHQERIEQPEETAMKPEYYPPPPYYPPFMYPPHPHLPPNLYPYQYPPPYGPPGSYPYGGMPMIPPMHMTSQSDSSYNYKGAQKNEFLPPITDMGPPSMRGSQRQGAVPPPAFAEKPEEDPYKMFGMGGNYMYPYPPPHVGYPGYPPPYMMYPPQAYDPRGYYDEQDDQLRSWRRRQLVDNQKQRIRKALKHLSAEIKIEMLDTCRILMKLDKMSLEAHSSELAPEYPCLKGNEGLNGGAAEKCYQRNLMKIEKWLKGEDDRSRDAISHLLAAFQLEQVKGRIRQLKEMQRRQISSLQSATKRLIDRLIVSKKQTIF